jgi:hypothetical protein
MNCNVHGSFSVIKILKRGFHPVKQPLFGTKQRKV